MGRDLRVPSRRMFRGAELTRLMTMVLMLFVVAMMMVRLHDPDTIRALDGLFRDDSSPTAAATDPGAPDATVPSGKGPGTSSAIAVRPAAEKKSADASKPAGPTPPSGESKPAAALKTPGESKTSEKSKPANPAAFDSQRPGAEPSGAESSAEGVTGPTDEDWEEAEALREELQAVSDRTLAVQPEEMHAYDRLVRWAENQSADAMFARAKKGFRFNDFVQSPRDHRGQLVELELNARLIRRWREPPKYASPLYEVWGATRDSGSWLYSCITVNLPKGLPLEQTINERIRFVGYFFKVQAYRPALARPGDAPEVAPLFIGRMVWLKPPSSDPAVASDNTTWWIVGIGSVVGMVVTLWVLFARGLPGRSARVQATLVASGPIAIEQWMDDLAADNPSQGNKSGVDDVSKEEGLPADRGARAGAGPRRVLDPDGMPPDNGRKGRPNGKAC
jgi:hypothetical protein